MKNARASNKPLTPPSSCQDLEMLNYYLDGLYLVKNQHTKKIQTVFCQFTAPSIGRAYFRNTKSHYPFIFFLLFTVSQQLIGNVEVKTKSVHFYVQKNVRFLAEKMLSPLSTCHVKTKAEQ